MKVVGWTSWSNFDSFPKDISGSYEDAVNAVAIALREYGYKFSGSDHQHHNGCAPIFDDGSIFRASQRGWGRTMAVAYPEQCGTDEYAYCVWAFENSENPIYPSGGNC